MRLLSLVGVLVLFCVPAAFAEPAQSYTIPQIQQHWSTIADLETRSVLSPEQAAAQREFYLAKASEVAGKKLSAEELASWTARESVINFSGVLRRAGAVVVVLAAALLFSLYFWSLIAAVPVEGWELLIYTTSVVMMFGTHNMWVNLPGALILLGAVFLTNYVHFENVRGESAVQILATLCAVVWGAACFYHGRSEFGYLCMIAIEFLLGFCILAEPLCIAIGFKEEQYIARGTFMSFLLLAGGVLLTKYHVPQLAAFVSPLIAVGSFVYFIGLLITSSKWVASHRAYWLMQIIAIASGFAAFYFGPLVGVPWLTGVGGTLFCIYLLEKYIEIPWRRHGYAWAALGAGGMLYGMAMLIHRYPEYFLIRW